MFMILNKNVSSIFLCIHKCDDGGFETSDLPKSKKINSWFKPPSSTSAAYTASTVATDSTVPNSSSESATSTNPLLTPDAVEICSKKNGNKLYPNIFNKQALANLIPRHII